jgi:hypothetical protein
MESPGVYWKPIFYVLEEAVICVLANAGDPARAPGRVQTAAADQGRRTPGYDAGSGQTTALASFCRETEKP